MVALSESAKEKKADHLARCSWARTPLMIAYHDTEWGVPAHDDRLLFEFLTLEGAQAGLSWETILKKRKNYREASTILTLPSLPSTARRNGPACCPTAGSSATG